MSEKQKRFIINIIAQVTTFVVQLGISFFLSSFIVNKIGADSYGFIGLAENFIMYAQLLLIALNSMAGRFIAIAYHQGDIKSANKYFSSVMIANTILACFFLLMGCIFVIFIDNIINIPQRLNIDVKILFMLSVLNFIISIVFSVYQVSTFIKNRLDLVAVRSIVSNIIRAVGLVLLFLIFPPHLFYINVMAVICTIYVTIITIDYTRKLTPDLFFSLKNFETNSIRELIASGIWNTVTKLGNTLAQGFDLLLTNLYINPIAMGYLALTKKIPSVVNGLLSSVAGIYAPTLTQYYAQQDSDKFKKELFFSIRFIGIITVIPFAFLIVYTEEFYHLWLPSEDYIQLSNLTLLSLAPMIIGMTFEGVQNIFTITNKVKIYSYGTLSFNVMVFISLIIGLQLTPSDYRLYFMVINSSFWGFCRVFFFLPIYAAKCISISPMELYKNLGKVVISLIIVISLLLLYKNLVGVQGWFSIIIACLVCVSLSITIGILLLLQQDERQQVFTMIGNIFAKH